MGCQSELPPPKYAAWVEDETNGLYKIREDDKYILSLQYKPIDYITVMRERTPKISKEKVQKTREELGNMEHFNFKLSTRAGKPALSNRDVQFDNKDIYLMSGMQKDLFLLEGKDTLYCRMFHFEGANGILPYDNCVLAFDKSKQPDEDKIFLYRADKLGLGWITIPIKADAINNIPKIKTY